MAVLPPDPLFRFKSDLGHLHCLCFLEHAPSEPKTIDEGVEQLTIAIKINEILGRQLLLAAGEAGIVYFFDLENNRLKYKQQMGISIQAIHTYNQELIIQEKEGVVTIFEVNHEKKDVLYKKLTSISCASGFCKIQLHNDWLLIPQENASVAIYDLKTKSQLHNLQYQGCSDINSCLHDRIVPTSLGQLMCIESGGTTPSPGNTASSSDITLENLIFCGYETGDVFMWDISTQKLLAHAKFNECIISITYDNMTKRGVVGGAGGELQVFGVDRSTNTLKPLAELALTNNGCQVVKIRKDRKILVSGGFDGRTRIYSWKTLRLLAALTENHACVTDVQFSTQVVPQWGSQIMAVCGADGVITLWNLYK